MTTPALQESPFEPTILGSVWHYRLVVITLIAAFGILGVLGSYLQPLQQQWSATATLVVEDPVQSTLFERPASQAARYVNDQVAILESTPVADETRRILSEAADPIDIEAADILDSTEVAQDANSNVLHVTFSADTEAVAIAGANAITRAYQEVRRSEVARGFQASLDQLDTFIAESEAEIATLQSEIEALRPEAVDRDDLDAQFADTVERLAALQGRVAVTASGDLPALQQQIEILVGELQALQLAIDIQAAPVGQEILVQEQAKAIDRKSTLITRRDQLEVDLELLGSGVTIESPAIVAEPPGSPSFIRNTVLALVLGIPVGAGTAYFLALRRRMFTARTEPETVLDAPLLAEIPEFREEHLTTDLPVRDAPHSEVAEGFRFNATSLALLAASARRHPGSRADAGVSVAFVAASAESGKTVTVANTAIAAASEGARVVVVDADLGDQKLSRLLSEHATESVQLDSVYPGIRALTIGSPQPNGGVLDLLPQQGLPVQPTRFFSSPEAGELLRALETEYDLVLLDLPPLLQVAYSSALVNHAATAAIVIPFGSRVASAQEVRSRVDLTATPILGYVFSRAPLRRDLKGSAASVLHARAIAAGPADEDGRSTDAPQ